MSISLPWAYGPHAWYVAGIVGGVALLCLYRQSNLI